MSKKQKIILAITIPLTVIIAAAAVMLTVVFCSPKKIADVSIENAGQSTLLQTNKLPAELSPEEVAYAFISKMSDIRSYKLVSSGATIANIMGGYVQNISDVGYKFGDEVYLQNISTSAFANINHEAFVKTVDGVSKVAYRDNGGGISVSDRDGKKGYKSVYGISPDDLAIGGYIFNSNTIESAERLEGNNRYQFKEQYANDYQFRYTLKGSDETTAFPRLQMVQYGELSQVPQFSEIVLYLTVSESWEPRELIIHTVYSAKKTVGFEMSMTCTQDITATYSEVNAFTENPIPDTQKFNEAIGSQPTTDAKGGNNSESSPVMSALMDVFNALAGQKWEEGVKMGAILDLKEVKILSKPFDFKLYAKYNPQAIENGAYLNAVNFRLDVDITGISGILSLLKIFAGDTLPAYISQMKSLSLCYTGNGYPAIVFKDANDKAIHVEEIDVVGMLLPLLGEREGAEQGLPNALKDLDINALMAKINEIFTVEERETGRALVLNGETVKKLDEGYQSLLEKLGELIGSDGGVDLTKLLSNVLGAKITGLEIKLAETDGEVNGLTVDISGIPFNKGDDVLSISLFSLSLSFDGAMTGNELSSLAEDIKALIEREETAAVYREKVQFFADEMWLGDTYIRRISSLKEEIDALEPDVKVMVYNYGLIDECIKKHNKFKNQADEFLSLIPEDGDWSGFEHWEDLQKLYNGRGGKIEETPCQREYIGEEVIEAYLSARAAANGV